MTGTSLINDGVITVSSEENETSQQPPLAPERKKRGSAKTNKKLEGATNKEANE